MEASTLHLSPRLQGTASRPLRGDERLVDAVRSGDKRAFEEIFDRYHRQLLSFCRHMLGSREEAEDAVQQTFLGAYRDMAGSEKPIHLRPWLYTIARNHSLSMLRARRENVSLEDQEPATEGLAPAVERRSDLRQMLVDLARLPEQQRAALVLAEIGALSHDEVAGVVGCPRDKVKALVFQARSSLAATRTARETPCSEVREQLSTLRGGALRRSHLRRHVHECEGCREFEAEVRRQRQSMALLLPVAPSAGFKSAVLAGVGASAGTGAVVGVGAGAGAVGGGLGLTNLVLLGAAVLAVGTGAVILSQDVPRVNASRAPAALSAPPATTGPGARVSHAIGQSAREVALGLAGAIEHGAGGRRQAEVGAPSREGSAGTGGSGTPRGSAGSAAGGSSRGSTGRSRPGTGGGSGGGSGDSPSGSSQGSQGRSGSAPGQLGTTPGQAGTSPGQSGQTPAHGAPPPGQAGSSPGQSGQTPGQNGGGSHHGQGGGGGGHGGGHH